MIPEDPAAALAAGRYNDTPVLTGLTRDEGSAMDPQYRPSDAAVYRESLARRYGSLADRFAVAYPAVQPAASNPELSRDRGIASMLFWGEGRRKTSRHAVFAYLFTHVEPGPDSAQYGAFHSSEIPYVFDTLDRSPGRTFTALDREVASRLGSYWANFVKTGDPNGAGPPAVAPAPRRRAGHDPGCPFAARPLDPERLELFREYVRSGRELGLF